MIYSTDILGEQWEIFFGSLLLGLMLGGCYDAFKIVRAVFLLRQRATVAADIIYCLWAGFLVFSFLLEYNFGMPRFYIFLGTAAGFFGWYFTVGRITARLSKFIRRLLRRVKRTVFEPLMRIFKKLFGFIGKKREKAEKFLVKKLLCCKKLLKKERRLVYNKLCLNKSAFPFCGGKAGKEPEKFESKGTEEKQEPFASGRSYCLRGVSSLLNDSYSGEHSSEKRGT